MTTRTLVLKFKISNFVFLSLLLVKHHQILKQRGSTNLLVHPHDAAQSLPLEHEVERRVDLREGNAVRDELLQLKLLPHVHIDDLGEVRAWLVVAKEGALECPLVQEIHGVGLEHGLLVGDANQHSHAPPLHPPHFRTFSLKQQETCISSIIDC